MAHKNKHPSNPFYLLAQALIARGEDMEVIARELAIAFMEVSNEGIGVGKDITEYARLSREA